MTDDRIDRTRLPVADPKCVGMANRALQGSRPDWGLIGHVAPPEGAPDVLVVLIDDAGVRSARARSAARSPFRCTPRLDRILSTI